MMNEIEKFVIEHIERKGKIPEDVDLSTFNFVKSGYIDSIEVFKFFIDIEAEFGIEITDEDLLSPQVMTIGGLSSIVAGKIESTADDC